MAKPPLPTSDTIAAVATPPGRGGVGIVRVSGTHLAGLAEALTGRAAAPRQALLRRFVDPAGELIDQGLLLYFPAPHSFTGEDVLELQAHGGPLVIAQLLARCVELGARLARPGEFSERAFHNGKLDLTQAEAIADLIEATTATAARSAARSLAGEFSAELQRLADKIIYLRALTEAALDFSDEEIEPLDQSETQAQVEEIESIRRSIVARAHHGQLLRDGLTVVLIGPPNVGKSSLLNRLAGDEIAIVSEHAGTTRDSLKSTIQLRGLPLNVVDTAGLRETADPVERLGIERTWRAINQADVALVVADARVGIDAADLDLIRRLPAGLRIVTVLNKSDLLDAPPPDDGVLRVSAATGANLGALEEALFTAVDWNPGEHGFIARQRHLDALARCGTHLAAAAAQTEALELFAEELRLAHRALQEITGEYSTEELLGQIFGSFCIGK